jgi:hypothetical protein
MKKDDRIVYRKDGQWINKKVDSDRASSVHDKQSQAEKAAREMLRNTGGGELITKGIDGKIRSKDTIPPAKDPCPPKDKEH